MADDEYYIPRNVLDKIESPVRERPSHCQSCGHPVDDDVWHVTEVPTCRQCGAPLTSDAAEDWLNTELN